MLGAFRVAAAQVTAAARFRRRPRRPSARGRPPGAGAATRRAPEQSRSRQPPRSRCRADPGRSPALASSISSASASTRPTVGISCATPMTSPRWPSSRRTEVTSSQTSAIASHPSHPGARRPVSRGERGHRVPGPLAVDQAGAAGVVVGGHDQVHPRTRALALGDDVLAGSLGGQPPAERKPRDRICDQ